MLKRDAINLFGSASSLALACRVTPQAVSGWPEVLPDRIADRVQAALWRQQQQATKRRRVKEAA